MNASILRAAKIRESSFNSASLKEVELSGALIVNSEFDGANLEGSSLNTAIVSDTSFAGANLSSSSLRSTILHRADLDFAALDGSDLVGARITESSCNSTGFVATLIADAEIYCEADSLKQDQLDLTVGNIKTILPRNRHAWSCIDITQDKTVKRLDEIQRLIEIRSKTSFDPYRFSRERFRSQLFCRDGERPIARGYNHFEKRFLRDFDGIALGN